MRDTDKRFAMWVEIISICGRFVLCAAEDPTRDLTFESPTAFLSCACYSLTMNPVVSSDWLVYT